jgi:hypothetical protein
VLSALSPAFTLAGPSLPLRSSSELPTTTGLTDAYTKLSLVSCPGRAT